MARPIFCSLGENCLTQGMIDRKKLPTLITPFSWARSNAFIALQHIQDEFRDLLQPEFLEKIEVNGEFVANNRRHISTDHSFHRSVSAGFELTHHDVMSSEKARASVERKIERFRNLSFESAEPVIFLYHHRFTGSSDFDTVTSLQQHIEPLHHTLAANRKGTTTTVAFWQSLVDSPDL